MSNAPHFDIDVAAFWADPYPALARMRKEAPIAFVPQLGSTVFTRRDDIFTQEKRIDVFSLAPAGGTDEHADGPQHDAQGRRGAHGRARGDVSLGVAAHGARHLERGSSRPMPTASSTSSRRRPRRSLQGVRAAVVGGMPEGHHRPDQHALPGHGCVVAGDDRRHRQLHRRQGGRGALPSPPPPASMPRSTT